MLPILGSIYGKIADVRNTLYEKGVFKVHNLGARTISIGNITTGGTGKTPLVMFVAEHLAEQGEKVCILTRGFGREDPQKRVLVSDGKKILADARMGGDEPVEIAQKLLGRAIVIADANRVASAKWAIAKFGVTAFVLDDAFQHRRAKRDVDVVAIDATNPFGGGKMLPDGRLREPLVNLDRADVIVLTRSNLVNDTKAIEAKIKEFAPDTSIFSASTRTSKVSLLRDFLSDGNDYSRNEKYDKDDLSGLPAFAFSALGNPTSFIEQLKRDNTVIVGTHAFADHHYYVGSEMKMIAQKARASGAELLITTGKDAVKLDGLTIDLPCYVLESELDLNDPAGFIALL